MNPFFNKSIFLISLFFLIFGKLSGQFVLSENTVQISDTCYQLTEAANNQVGSIWNENKIDLSSSFVVTVDLNFGDQDEGADGIVFVLQTIGTSIFGNVAGAIGYEPIGASVGASMGVEFDTWQNSNFADPVFDHIAILKNGTVNHNTIDRSLAGPVQANPNSMNIEDGTFHNVRILWNSDKKELSVYFDCELRLSYTGDIVNDIFRGETEVFWGFTSSTGGFNNVHQVCISYTTLLNGLEDKNICVGGSVQLEASGGVSYKWSPEIGLSNPNIANPIASPAINTEYTVEITDDCGVTFKKDLWVNLENAQTDEFIIPNIFSPNGDGRNDSFGLFIMNDELEAQNYSCKIFNRWGQIVFDSSDPSEFWNGMHNSKNATVDVYIYKMAFELNGLCVEETGDVTLLR